MSEPRGHWERLGPYLARNLTDGTITVEARGGHANFSGVEVWAVDPRSADGKLGMKGKHPKARGQGPVHTSSLRSMRSRRKRGHSNRRRLFL
ncbi:hypothetical protein HQ563_15855 [bacterium]|nr:hypothetical protein [bacterium]